MNIDKEQFEVLEQHMEKLDEEFLSDKTHVFTAVSKSSSIGEANSIRRFLRLELETSSRVKKICITNIKSLKNVEIELSNLNIVAGINSIGKSTLLEAIALLPRYFDSELDIIPLGDDKFGNKNFKNFLSTNVELDEFSSISIIYDNIFQGKTIGEVVLSFSFDDSLRDMLPGLTKAGRALEIAKINYLPIKSISLEVLQDPQKTKGMDIVPIKAKIELENNRKKYNTKSYDLGTYIEKNRLFGSSKDKENLHKEFQDKYKNKENYTFTVSVNTPEESASSIDNKVSLHNLNFDKFSYKLSKQTISKDVVVNKHKTEAEYEFNGNMTVEISKYLRLLILDIIASENNNLKDNNEFKNQFKKLFFNMLNETKNIQLSKEKLNEFIKIAEKNTFDDRGIQRELAMNSTLQYLMGLRAQAYSILNQSYRTTNMGGGPLSRKKGLKDGTYFKGIFDWIKLEDLDTSLQKKVKIKKIHNDVLELWFDDTFNSEKITEYIDDNKNILKERLKALNVNNEIGKFFDSAYGDYANFLNECSKYINKYSELIKSENFESAKKYIDEFIDKVTLQLKKDNVSYPFNSNLHSSISTDLKSFTLRDLILMKICHKNYNDDDLLVPLYKVKDLKMPKFINAFLSQGTNTDITEVPIFDAIKNFKNIQFLGPLRDRGDSTKLFYKKEIPFTLGIFGEYSKIFLKENALEKSEFVTPKLFDEKFINLIIDKNKFQQTSFADKLIILRKEGVLSELTYIDFVSKWGKYLGICEKFEINNESESPSIFVVDSSGNSVDIVNVGIGVSQVLPVILICSLAGLNRSEFTLKDPNIILLEQPELHLHPKAQAKLADFILANSLIDSIVLETHSEYTLNRLRYRHAQFGSFLGDHININYVRKDSKNNPAFERILINEEGGLNAYPEDFFDQSQLQAQDFIKLKISKKGKK